MYLSISKKKNFTQIARFGRSCESRFRQNVFIKPDEQRELAHSVVAGKLRQQVNFKKAFDWIGFNRSFFKPVSGNLVTLAIDQCFISNAGKKTPGIGYFWSGCASAMNGLNMSVGSIKTLMHNASMLERFFHVRWQAELAFKSQRFQRTFVLRCQGHCLNFKYLTYY